MTHPKMKFTYVGVDSHKDTHTAVFLDCFFEKLGEIKFSTLPSKYPAFLEGAENLKVPGTELMFGLEDVSMYGRTLAAFLKERGIKTKHINSILVAMERKNSNTTEKTDSIDSLCAARVLIVKLNELPDGGPDDRYFILKGLVTSRKFTVRQNTALKNRLHNLLTQHYPNYRDFFPDIGSAASLAFFGRYPSPSTLAGVPHAELAAFLKEASGGRVGGGRSGTDRARDILSNLEDTAVAHQDIRDRAVMGAVRQIVENNEEIAALEINMAEYLNNFDSTLTSMCGIDTVSAAEIMSIIGDVRRFSTSAKLARYAGIAPVSYASGRKESQYPNKRGNRDLNSAIYLLAVRLIATNKGMMYNQFFHQYYHRKLSEGKTKMQSLKCVQRRLVNIIWSMLTHGRDYENPPMLPAPEKGKRG
jgi:transposase